MNYTEKNIKLYTELVKQYGVNYKSLNWGSQQSQEKRFEVLTSIGNISGKSILDVGCGTADLYFWLQKKKYQNVKYYGIDITSAMIVEAKKRFYNIDFFVGTIDQLPKNTKYDYLFASGIFTYLDEKVMHKTITEMFERANYGIAFNTLCIWSEQRDCEELYSDPLKTIEYCKSLSQKIVFRNDYHNSDYTIYLYK